MEKKSIITVILAGVLAFAIGGVATWFVMDSQMGQIKNNLESQQQSTDRLVLELKKQVDELEGTSGEVSKTENLSSNLSASGSKNETTSNSQNSQSTVANKGTKAHGTITVYNHGSVPHQLPKGTKFTSPEGKVFISLESMTLPRNIEMGYGKTAPGSINVNVEAEKTGADYNISAINSTSWYTISGFPSSSSWGGAPTVYGGSGTTAMAGGS